MNHQEPQDEHSPQGKIKIYGIHAIAEAIAEGVSFNRVYIQKDSYNERIADLIKELKKHLIPFQLVPREKLSRMTSKPHQGVVALTSPVSYQSIEQVLPMIYEHGNLPLLALLDGVTDIRNFGAIARSAECFGIDALITPSRGTAMINEEAIKSSAGALHRIQVCREMNMQDSIGFLKNSGIQLIACSEKATKNVREADFSAPCCIVMGSEGEGIHPSLLDQCDTHVRIPMQGNIQSLNVSVAAGIIFYEASMARLSNYVSPYDSI